MYFIHISTCIFYIFSHHLSTNIAENNEMYKCIDKIYTKYKIKNQIQEI